ncbi:DNA-processing protein DprA [Clostridium cochlearium]|uniref:DNA-processing protein DprA n=1 Tax=Clostridium cochlearium TaxID=1494 RepID=UPI00156EBD38|nr:DNA-processing protein DprA [Clostridium cochlearium]MBV1819367.1 DNA-processing protein DprA [Bacteroidales bacterium MSK.15.36]MCG4572195.1 DNA-processing protein DprA [Clostridium cochlearium]MCG4580210.1 DNA-processing protein DprA [Clostridium cochlearium]NSJ91646.1 DNA-protecting protein DprA [Coprococcus sp. MSK.21.13]
MENLVFYIWLTTIKGLGSVLSRRLLNYYKNPEIIYNLTKDELMQVEGIGIKLAKTILNSKDLTHAKNILENCNKKCIKITTLYDDIFPKILNNYKDAPILLYYKGNLNKNLKGVAIVGARRCSEYGKDIAIESASYLAKQGIPVISGMAKGIDGYAHTACLKNRGYTVAILGCGVDICYPKEHSELMKKIIENGVVLSEYSSGTRPEKNNFPKRNKLISFLSEKVLVVEAGEKSGSLITSEYAKKQNKVVLAPPNNKYLKGFTGTNKLIKEGAQIYLEPNQLLIEGMEEKNKDTIKNIKNKQNIHSDLESKILNLLKNKSLTIDEIRKVIKIDKDKIINILLNLELQGELQTISGGRYAV